MMWWGSFVAGCFVGAIIAVMIIALIFVAGDEYHGRR